MTKPIGPICNLDCAYCYYLAKESLYPDKKGSGFRMPDEVLERYVRQYIEAQAGPVVNFAWQGGEPTLLGVEFFERVVELQGLHCPPGKRIENALQTNGTLLDDRWAEFLRRNNFLVGISIDGPAELHDRLRYAKDGRPSLKKVLRGRELLQQHGVDYNVLTTVNSVNVHHPLRMYRYLVGLGATYLQFIPIVERAGRAGSEVTSETVPAEAYGAFLCAIFDEWVRADVGRVFVQIFDNTLGIWAGAGSSLCVFAQTCGAGLAIEHNGDVYSCDHFVFLEHRLGNIRDVSLKQLVNSDRQVAFGMAKRDMLPRYCRECDVRFSCNGECPKNRFRYTPDGEPGLNYLCAAYKRFYRHVAPAMDFMVAELRAGRSPANVMTAISRRELLSRLAVAGRNDPCPCGSGVKFKRCCGSPRLL